MNIEPGSVTMANLEACGVSDFAGGVRYATEKGLGGSGQGPRCDPVAKHIRGMFDAYGEAWGYQWRFNFGRAVRISVPCLLGKFVTEGFAATDGRNKDRRYPEVFLGMGQKFSIALQRAAERDREMAFAHYVLEHVHVTRKASALNIERSTYYQRLDAMRAAMLKHVLGEDVDVSIWTNDP
jgi:hypothetical protein